MNRSDKGMIVGTVTAISVSAFTIVLYYMALHVVGMYNEYASSITPFYIGATGVFLFAIAGGFGLSLIPGLVSELIADDPLDPMFTESDDDE